MCQSQKKKNNRREKKNYDISEGHTRGIKSKENKPFLKQQKYGRPMLFKVFERIFLEAKESQHVYNWHSNYKKHNNK